MVDNLEDLLEEFNLNGQSQLSQELFFEEGFSGEIEGFFFGILRTSEGLKGVLWLPLLMGFKGNLGVFSRP